MQLLDRELLQQLGVCKESQKSFHGITDLMNLCATGAGLAVSFGIQVFVWDSIYWKRWIELGKLGCMRDGSNYLYFM